MVEYHALGGLTVTVGGQEVPLGGARQRRLLAVFLIHRNTVVSVDRLADAVFAGEPTPGANTTLRSYVARIRRVVADGDSAPTVITQAPGYLMTVADDAVDVARFENGVVEAEARAADGDHAEAAASLRAALGLWQGDAYAEFADEDWARPEAQRLGELRLVAFERLFEAELELGRAATLIPEIEGLVEANPTREGLRAQLMIALYRAGRQADALRSFQDLRRDLRDELGLDPTPALVDLERRLLAQDPTLLVVEPTGQRLRGYVLGERLGTGRDGTVFAARLPGVDRDLAIRVVNEAVADGPEFVRSFESTTRRIASLDHPAIVPIHDYWREPGAAYLVMRRLHGGSLTDRLARGPLSVDEAARLVDRVGGALLAASEAGLAHGRVSPDSVLFDDAGDPCLGDFALAATAAGVSDRDVHDLAVLVRTCLGGGVDAADVALARGVAPSDRPSMAEYVPLLGAALADEDRVVGPPPNPYKGLRAFDEADAADFFGRADVVDEVLRRLGQDGRQGRLVLVVGGSGTGKSSVVRAGVLPAVRAGALPGSAGWFVTTMLPGTTPFAALAESLRQVAVVDSAGLAEELAADPGAIDRVIRRVVPEGGQMLLLVDQFEELFTSATVRDQKAFLSGLLHATTADDSRLRVVATLRADFYDRPLGVSGFGAVVNDATVTIPAMSAAELEAAVVGPAERVGRRVESALVAVLVSAVADEAAALPALQFTLYELAQRGGSELTLAAYRELGELEGAIAARAEGLYRTLDDDERADVRRLFEQLVVVAPGEEPTRRRAPRTELSAGPGDDGVGATIDRLTAARLLSVDRHPQTRVPTVELAHEALLREWPRLQGWIEEGREDLGALTRLRDAAASWLQVGRDPGALYRGAQLAMVDDVVDRGGRGLPPLDDEFLAASRQARDAEAQEVADRVARQARSNRRLRIQLAAIAIALVVALVGGVVAVDQRGEARQERRLATARELAVAAGANVATDAERAILLALAAVDATRSEGEPVIPEAVEALHQAMSESRVLLTVPDIGGSVAWSPDGELFATEGPEGSGLIDIRDARTGDAVRSFSGQEIDVNDVAFSPDGSMLATTGDDGALRLWDPRTGEPVISYRPGDEEAVWGPSFSADGRWVAASWLGSGVVRVIPTTPGAVDNQHVADGAVLDVSRRVVELPAAGARATTLSPDGRRVAAGSDGPAPVFDVRSGEVLFTVGAPDGVVQDLAFSPDGRWLATAGDLATVRVWRGDTGEAAITITGHTGYVNGVAWSPDSTRLATAGDDGVALVTELTDGRVAGSFALSASAAGSGLFGVAFSPDGQRLLTGDTDIGATRLWDVSPRAGAEWGNLRLTGYLGAAFTGRGDEFLSGDPAGGVAVWEVASGDRGPRLGVPPGNWDDLSDFAVSDDGALVALVWNQRQVEIWDLRERELLADLPRAITGGHVGDVAWTHRGHRLAVGARLEPTGDRQWVSVVDSEGNELSRLAENAFVTHDIGQLAFSADDRLLANTRDTEQSDASMGARIWDWEAEETVRFIETPSVSAEFAPTGDRLVTARQFEGMAEVWDASSGERLMSLTAPGTFNDVSFSPDGSRLATAGADGVVRLWDAETGEPQLALRGHLATVRVVDFSADGSRLLSVDDDGVARVWALDLDDLIELASGHVSRSLTEAECRQYLHVDTCPEA